MQVYTKGKQIELKKMWRSKYMAAKKEIEQLKAEIKLLRGGL